ncbi:MAG: DVU0772 family protein, partial [Acidobacteriota bacterium]
MWKFEELRDRREIIDRIDWEMTPEKAVETYLEWGTGWSRKGDYVSYAGQESYYFVIYAWETPPGVTLVRRDSQGAEELARVDAPADLVNECIIEAGRKPGVGVYALSESRKTW